MYFGNSVGFKCNANAFLSYQ